MNLKPRRLTKQKQIPQTQSDFAILAKPAQRALARAGYIRLEQLTKVSEAELNQLHGMGPNALARLRQALKAKGLAFAKGETQ